MIGEVRAELCDGQAPRGNAITVETDPAVPPVSGDRAQLSQMLHNLIGNAMKYGRAGTPVTVRLWRDAATMVRISVVDEGDGIAAEHIPRLTERFYRVDPGRSRAAGAPGSVSRSSNISSNAIAAGWTSRVSWAPGRPSRSCSPSTPETLS